MKVPRRPRLHTTALWVALLSGGLMTAQAQEPRVRTSLADTQDVWVGQGVNLVVEVLVPGYFDSAVHFQLPDPAGVLLMPPQSYPLVSNETLEGVAYTVQRHELKAWPMRAGDISIPSFGASFSYKENPLDEDGQPGSVTTQPVALKVQLPPGAENLGLVISARRLQVREAWEPDPGDAQGGEEAIEPVTAGSAYSRRITWSAPDIPGMLFPPFPAEELDGVGVYSRQQLRDREDRGDFTGERRDEVTYVFQRPGQFTLPEIRFTWFDLDSQQLRTETLAARTFNVVVNPGLAYAAAGQPGAPPAGFAWQRWALLLGLIAALLAMALRPSARRAVQRVIAPLRPVRLRPLNPANPAQD